MRTRRARRVLVALALLAAPRVQAQPAPEPQAAAPASEPSDAYGAVATTLRLARPVREVPAQVSVLRRDEIDANPSLTTDSLLRTLPAVATFRRSTSLVADPSSQGLNLRGLGPSGVSRTLVLMDGVPANDPFGGWIYWRALPRLGLARIEVAPGGASALYGSAALGGVVQLFSRSARDDALDAYALYGSQITFAAGARAAHGWGPLGLSLEGEWLRSDGYHVVAEDQRGPIDGRAPSPHGSLQARTELQAHPRMVLWSALSLFREDQNGGTRLTRARVDLGSLAIGADIAPRRGGQLRLSAFGRLTRFEQQRARIGPERTSETRAALQRVPASDEGGSIVYTSPTLGEQHTLAAGLDVRHIRGESRERLYPQEPIDSAKTRRNAGGQQLLLGAYLQDVYRARPWLGFDAALRFDTYRTYAASRSAVQVDGTRELQRFDPQQAQAVSPRLGAVVNVAEALTLRAAGYRAFRAPTLNELYRPFQVGTVLTAANEDLKPEYLTGGELGFDWTIWRALSLRATGFANRLEQPIGNVTLAQPLPDGAMRRRENLGRARVAGVESSLEWRLDRRFAAIVAYSLADSRVTAAPGLPGVRGKRLPQDPVHRGSVLLFFVDPALLDASLQLRVIGSQYEDDQNTLRMDPVVLLDASCAKRLVWKLEVFVTAENILDRVYLVGRAGVDTVGQPFSARVGLRIRERAEP